MTSGAKGAWLGGAAILAIALLWAAVAGTHDDLSCVHYEHTPAGAILTFGLMFGLPCGIYVGTAIGGLAGRLRDLRRVILLLAAIVLACVLTLLARMPMQCSTDPSTSTLWVRAFVPLVLASGVLERWTRPDEPLPRATAL